MYSLSETTVPADLAVDLVEPEARETRTVHEDKDGAEDIVGPFLSEHPPVEADLPTLGRYYRRPYVSLRKYRPDDAALALIKHDVARELLSIPLFRLDDVLYVGMVEPLNLYAQDFLQQLTGYSIEPVVVLRSELDEALNHYFLGKVQSEHAIGAISAQEAQRGPLELLPLHFEDQEAPVVKLVNFILSQAIHLGASDIHFEPFQDTLVLRYRVDGALHEFSPPPLPMYRSLVSRVKIMSNLDISEKRLPQDGRMSFTVAGRDHNLRISCMPGVHGENLVIRILHPLTTARELESLGFATGTLDQYLRLLQRPHGMVLVTGPTGCGKTTTLYATLKRIYSPKKKIITLEDPVECHLEGVNQFQINSDIGFTFSHGLRATLRHDPDIIMLGEIRDLESAEIALRASLTGHLVFSTLHTNDAPLAITRLVDMGIPPFLVLSSLLGVMAQRLIRLLCTSCRRRVWPDASALAPLGITEPPPSATFYQAVGCTACNNLGYHGRTAVYELLCVTPDMRRLTGERLTPGVVRDMARGAGFVTLRESALEKLYSGATSVEEIVSLATSEFESVVESVARLGRKRPVFLKRSHPDGLN